MLLRVIVLAHILWKLAEGGGFRVHRTFEAANRHFVVVASIDYQHFGVGDDVVPVLWLHVSAHGVVGVDARHAQRDDLFFQFDLGAVERRLVAKRLFMVDIT